jgi:hypothetical protein
LRTHLLAGFGDIPALSKILEFLGHNGHYPCRLCLVVAVQGSTSKGGTHLYCPLHQMSGTPIDPVKLPLCAHHDCICLGLKVLQAPNDHARTQLASQSGIKGVSVLSQVLSVSIPSSFPIDIMHMVWINLVPQLTKLWTRQFNDLDEGVERYSIPAALWEALGDLTEASGTTIPSTFGCCIPNLKTAYL